MTNIRMQSDSTFNAHICSNISARTIGRNLNALILWVANYDVSSYHVCAWNVNVNLSSIFERQDRYTQIL